MSNNFYKIIVGLLFIINISTLIYYNKQHLTSGEKTHDTFILFKVICCLFFLFLAYTYPFMPNNESEKYSSKQIAGIATSIILFALSIIIFITFYKLKHPLLLIFSAVLFGTSILIPTIYGDSGLIKSETSTMMLECSVVGLSVALGFTILYISRAISTGRYRILFTKENILKFIIKKFIPLFLLGFIGDIILEDSGFNNIGLSDDPKYKLLPSTLLTYFVYFVIACVFILFIMSCFSDKKSIGYEAGKFINYNLFQFIIEGLLLGAIGAAPLWLMEKNRKSDAQFKNEKTSIAIHFIEVTIKIFICHLILQFTGVYNKILD